MSPQAGQLLVHEVIPRVRSLRPSFTSIGSDDPEEQAQDAIAIAAKLLVSTEARAKKVTAGNITYYALARLVHEQLGADILARVQDQPRWRNNLEACRQKLACRYERQTT